MVCVQLPELAIYHIEMLIREVPAENSISSMLYMIVSRPTKALGSIKKAGAVLVEPKRMYKHKKEQKT